MTLDTPTNLSRPYELFQYAHNVTEGYLGTVIVLATFMIAFIALKQYRPSAAFAASSFITTTIAMLLRSISMLNDTVLFACIFITIGSLALLLLEGKWN